MTMNTRTATPDEQAAFSRAQTRGNGADVAATHSEMAALYVESLRAKYGTRPVYDEGAMWVCDQNVWREHGFDVMEVEIGNMFVHERACRRGADYSQIAKHAAKTCATADFFLH